MCMHICKNSLWKNTWNWSQCLINHDNSEYYRWFGTHTSVSDIGFTNDPNEVQSILVARALARTKAVGFENCDMILGDIQ